MLKEKEPRLIVTCTDGSDAAYMAFEVALKEFLDEEDKITVLHISDVEKTYLPYKYQVPSIINTHKLIQSRYSILVKERDRLHFDDVRKQVGYLCSKLSADYVFLGTFGRKGQQDIHFRVGKTALAMAKNSKVPITIIKKKFERAKNKSKGFNFVCCVDGSNHSLKTLSVAKDLARNLNDKVYALKIYDPETTPEDLAQEEKEKFEADLQEQGIKIQEVIFVGKKEEQTLEEAIEQYINFEGSILFDFVLLGVCGKRAEHLRGYFLGNTADHIIRRAFVNIVLVP